jgi:hypothetical protein
LSPSAAQTQPTAARATIAATRDGEADAAGNIAWRHRAVEWLRRDGSACARPKNDFDALDSGVLVLIGGEVIQPSLSWLLTPGTVHTQPSGTT